MSTKIYTGFRILGMSWRDLHAQVLSFRDQVKGIIATKRYKELGEIACQTIDGRILGAQVPNGLSPIVIADREVSGLEKADPPSFKIVLIPASTEDLIYGLTFGGDPYEDLWSEKPFVEWWPYWNNTDQPEDVTDEEWSHRRDTWDELLGDRSPAMAGFSAQCISAWPPLSSTEQVLNHLPSLDERVRFQATYILFRERCAGQKPGVKYGSFMGWISGPDGQQRLAEECERIRPLLPAEITLAMLRGKG